LTTIVDGWDGFAQVTGDAAAALIGLLFVAVSIRINVIARSGDLRNRAAQTLSLLGIVLLVAIAVSLPDQQRWVVGVEVIVVAAVAAVTLRLLDRRANQQKSEQRIAHVLDVIAPNIVTCVLVFVAGALLVFGLVAGLYVLAVAAVIALVGAVVSAWLLLVRVVE
jgi:mannose/fructose/N-acetylgalactosamine-specific phosphotransferase system component IID